jgi:hypothetical protein
LPVVVSVENFHMSEKAPLFAPFFAPTLQKKVEASPRELTEAEFEAMEESSNTTTVIRESVLICKSYEPAPGTEVQLKEREVGCPVAPLDGAIGVGAARVAAVVVNDREADQGLVPPVFAALTRQ